MKIKVYADSVFYDGKIAVVDGVSVTDAVNELGTETVLDDIEFAVVEKYVTDKLREMQEDNEQ